MRAVIAALLVAGLLFALPMPMHAQELAETPQPGLVGTGEHRAGLVVVHGDGSVVRQCVAFSEESISGYELLKRAERKLSVEAGAIGATVCAIDGEGCSYPQQSCFCQCQGSPCVYWSYWRMAPAGWQYQNLGAGNTKVRDGDVEGWHWAEGTTKDAKQPPAASFAEICGGGATGVQAAVSVTATLTPPLTPTAAVVQAPAGEATSVVVATATRAPVAQVVATADASGAGAVAVQGQLRLLWIVLLGLVVLPAAALAVLALLRRRGG